jgi:cell division protein FtsL
MYPIEELGQLSKRKKSRVGIFVLLAIFLYLSYVAVGQQKLLSTKGIELTKIESKIKDETKANDELKNEKKMIGSDEYKEKVAREKLGMVKKDERVFVDIGQ